MLSAVTEPMAQLYRIIPVERSRQSNTLAIAMCDPQKLSIQDELRTFLGYEIRAVVVATERDCPESARSLLRHVENSESVESIVADMEGDMELAEGGGRRALGKRAPST